MAPPRDSENIDDWVYWSKFVVKTLERLDMEINRAEEKSNEQISFLKDGINEMDKIHRACLMDLERAQNKTNTEFATAIRGMKVQITIISGGIAAGISIAISLVIAFLKS